MPRDLVRVSPAAIRWKISTEISRDQLHQAKWSAMERVDFTTTDKYRSIRARYVEGQRWADTPLFTQIYAVRFARGEKAIRGCHSIAALLAQYETRVDAMYAHLREHGYQDVVDGVETIPMPVYLAPDGELLMGNQGNHRLAMAQILGLGQVVVEIIARHPDTRTLPRLPVVLTPVPRVGPDLPACADAIPAMTTEAERRCYYRLTRQQAPAGAVVELGAWLGAASAYIAAGMRDAGVAHRAQIYDRFVWKPDAHNKKAGGPLPSSQLDAFRTNLGPLLAHVDVYAQEVMPMVWRGGPVSLLVCDAPKRIPEIASVLSAFAKFLGPGSLMAWQDFAYFPSYDIPAAISRLGDHVELTEAVYPGTTAVFRVIRPWSSGEVTAHALALRRWTPDQVERVWDQWQERLPEGMRPRWACGAAMFLCDLGAADRARRRLQAILSTHGDAVLPKWRYLLTERAALMQRYQPLVDVVRACA